MSTVEDLLAVAQALPRIEAGQQHARAQRLLWHHREKEAADLAERASAAMKSFAQGNPVELEPYITELNAISWMDEMGEDDDDPPPRGELRMRRKSVSSTTSREDLLAAVQAAGASGASSAEIQRHVIENSDTHPTVNAVRAALARMVKRGEVSRVKKGVYRATEFE